MKGKLYEFNVLIRRAVVIAAEDESQARKVFETWESAWENYSDFVDVCDVDLSEARDIPEGATIDRLNDEAHDMSLEIREYYEKAEAQQ